MSIQFSSIWRIHRTLSDATTPGQSGPGSNGNEGVLRISESSSITGTSPPDRLVSYLGHLLGMGVLPLCRDAVSVFYCPKLTGQSSFLLIPSECGPGSNDNEGVLRIPPNLQHYWSLTIRLFRVISKTFVRDGSFTPLQRGSWCILQPQPTWQDNDGVLHIPQSSSITGTSPPDCLES